MIKMTVNMKKMFLEAKTGQYTAAMSTSKMIALHRGQNPYIYRVWLEGEKAIGKALIYAYGESVSTIKNADAYIERSLKEKKD